MWIIPHSSGFAAHTSDLHTFRTTQFVHLLSQYKYNIKCINTEQPFDIVFFPGVSEDPLVIFSRVGDNVSLLCNNVINPGDCSSTTWLYSSHRSGTSEEVAHGKIKQMSKRAVRLRLESDCSLSVCNVRAKDAGTYICQQFPKEGGPQQGNSARVYLSLLKSKCFIFNSVKPVKRIQLAIQDA